MFAKLLFIASTRKLFSLNCQKLSQRTDSESRPSKLQGRPFFRHRQRCDILIPLTLHRLALPVGAQKKNANR